MDSAEIQKLTEVEDRHWWYAERRQLLARAIRHDRPGRAVDIGAAGGGNTRVLRAHGWRAVALEYGADGARIAAARGVPAIRGDATALPVASASFDLVVAFDVLEHIVDDQRAAAEIVRVLRPGGTGLIAVPCDPDLWSAHDEAVHHVRRYTRDGLTDLLRGAGLEIEQMTSWNVLLRPVVKLRRRSSKGSDLDERIHPALNAGLKMLISAERVLPLQRRRGVSLIARVRTP